MEYIVFLYVLWNTLIIFAHSETHCSSLCVKEHLVYHYVLWNTWFIYVLWNTWFILQPHNLISKIVNSTTVEERAFLEQISADESLTATLLPVKTVGVQVK